MTSFFWNYSDTVFPLLSLLLLIPCFVMKNQQAGFALLLVYLFINVVLMGYGNYLADNYIRNTHVYHIFTIAESCLIPLMLNRMSVKKSRYAAWISAAFVLYAVINMFTWEDYNFSFNSNAGTILNIIISIFCFRYFIALARNDEVLNFQKLPSFWIASGFLFYNIVSILVVAGYKNSQWFEASDLGLMWKIQQVANIVKFVLITIGIICCYRPISPSSGLSPLDQHP